MAAREPSGHYFDPDPGAPSRPGRVRLELSDVSLELATDRGVFAAERVDTGTRELLATLGTRELPAGDLVDVGAGYGPIACTLALRHPDRTVWAVEVNERARELCRANADAAGVGARVKVVSPDDAPAGASLGAIVSNPPIRIGKDALHELLATWLVRLQPEGEAWLVVHRHLGADSLVRWLESQGHQTKRVASRKGYRILCVSAG